MRLVNLTKRPLRLHDTDGNVVELAPDPRHVGLVSVGDHGTIDDADGHRFSLNVQRVRGVKGLPEPEKDTMYVVPIEVAMAIQHKREDVAYAAEDADVRLANGESRRISHLRRLVPVPS